MPFELFLALRYLYTNRRRKLARVTAFAALAGIACGVASLILALGLANGFRDEMRNKILRGTAHITAMRRDGQPLQPSPELLNRIKSTPHVVDAWPTTYEGALISGPSGSAYGVLRGISSDSTAPLGVLRESMVSGSMDSLRFDAGPPPVAGIQSASPPENRGPDLERYNQIPSEAATPTVIIGSELSARTGLVTGSMATLLSSETTLTPLGAAPRYRRVRIGGVFRTGLYEYDSTWIYLPLAEAADFAGLPKGAAGVISIDTDDIYNVSQVSSELRRVMGDDFTTVDWEQANRALFAALALERRMGVFIIGLIVFIAVLNITATLILLVVERRGDIAILSAMGASSSSIMTVFVIEGAVLGLIGAVLGVALGLAGSALGNRFNIVSLPADVYSISNIPFHPQAADIVFAALLAFGLSLVATLYPARAAARMRPAVILREV